MSASLLLSNKDAQPYTVKHTFITATAALTVLYKPVATAVVLSLFLLFVLFSLDTAFFSFFLFL